MSEATKKGEKFTKAREFLFKNPTIASTLINWRKMHGPTLYKALSLSGVQWDINSKTWSLAKKVSTADQRQIKVSTPALSGDDLTVQVRVIAHEQLINKSVSELLELASALDWLLLRNSGVRKGHYGSGRLVYLKFRLPRS